MHLAVFDGRKEQLLGLRSLGNDHKAAGAGVQPVAQGGGVQVVFLVLALLVQVQQRAVQQSIVLRAIHRNAGGLVHDQDLRAVVHHLRRGAGVLPRGAFHPAVGVQNVIQNEQLDLVACHHAGGKRLFFAVQLDLVLPQRLVQTAGGQGGVLLGQIIVQPGGGKTFYF